MTPFAQRIFRRTVHLLGNSEDQFPHIISRSACFDISDIIRTIYATSHEMSENPTLVQGDCYYDHGGLLFMPAPFVWIEFTGPSGKVGLLLNEVEEEIGVNMVADGITSQHAAFIERADGDLFAVRPYANLHGLQNEKLAADGAIIAAIALMLINAPRGVIHEQQAIHKGLVREARRYGIGPILPAHKIILDVNAGNIGGETGSGASSEKAFHYCRSHVRRLSPDRSVIVRGHWRGNPAIGIAHGDYIVRGDSRATIH